jgi:predicted RNA-binding protein associated with RNAse of E/G family
MIDINVIEQTVLAKLDSIEVGHCIEIRTYKRNRSVLFVKLAGGAFRVLEKGYREETFEVRRNKMKKLLKTLIKREFPRSRKVRLYDLGEYDPEEHDSMGRKKL